MTELTQTKTMPLKTMREYLGEWFVGIKTSIEDVPSNPNQQMYVIRDNYTKLIEFIHIFDKGTFSEEMIVSTEEIIGQELRGLIEQCVELDEQSKMYAQEKEPVKQKQ